MSYGDDETRVLGKALDQMRERSLALNRKETFIQPVARRAHARAATGGENANVHPWHCLPGHCRALLLFRKPPMPSSALAAGLVANFVALVYAAICYKPL